MGLRRFTLYDFDTVEEHNLASQAYSAADVGQLKVEAIKNHMLALNPEARVTWHNEPYKGQVADDVVISAVDSLDARRTIAEGLRDSGAFVVDGRMGGGQIEVHSQPASEWAATIPDEASSDPCGARYISYTSYIIAGLIANNVKRHLSGESVAKRILMHADTL